MAHKYLLILRFALVNLVAAGLVAAAWMQGWFNGVTDRTTLILSGIVVLVFLYGLALCGYKVWQTSRALNDMKAGGKEASQRATEFLSTVTRQSAERRGEQISMLRLKLSHKIQIVRQIANMLVFLGLIGTVIGFIIALSGVEPQAVSQAESVATMVATLIRGMSVALYTTLLGAVLNVWLNVNYRILSTGTVNLIAEVVRFGEAHGSA